MLHVFCKQLVDAFGDRYAECLLSITTPLPPDILNELLLGSSRYQPWKLRIEFLRVEPNHHRLDESSLTLRAIDEELVPPWSEIVCIDVEIFVEFSSKLSKVFGIDHQQDCKFIHQAYVVEYIAQANELYDMSIASRVLS